jgi:hypothetical protein
MNIKEINPGTNGTLVHYVVSTIPLTAVTIWIVIAVQRKYLSERPDEVSIWGELVWPLITARRLFSSKSLPSDERMLLPK